MLDCDLTVTSWPLTILWGHKFTFLCKVPWHSFCLTWQNIVCLFQRFLSVLSMFQRLTMGEVQIHGACYTLLNCCHFFKYWNSENTENYVPTLYTHSALSDMHETPRAACVCMCSISCCVLTATVLTVSWGPDCDCKADNITGARCPIMHLGSLRGWARDAHCI